MSSSHTKIAETNSISIWATAQCPAINCHASPFPSFVWIRPKPPCWVAVKSLRLGLHPNLNVVEHQTQSPTRVIKPFSYSQSFHAHHKATISGWFFLLVQRASSLSILLTMPPKSPSDFMSQLRDRKTKILLCGLCHHSTIGKIKDFAVF